MDLRRGFSVEPKFSQDKGPKGSETLALISSCVTAVCRTSALLLIIVYGNAACGGNGGGSAESTATSQAVTPTAPAEGILYEAGYRSGVATIDDLMEVLEHADGPALAAKLELLRLPCTKQTQGGVTQPPCEPSEQEGTVVEVMVYAGCQLGFVREPKATELLTAFGNRKYLLAFAYDNGLEVRVVVSTGQAAGYATVFLNRAGAVTGLSDNCGGELSIPRVDDVTFIVPPR
jgi:hypothetical protein